MQELNQEMLHEITLLSRLRHVWGGKTQMRSLSASKVFVACLRHPDLVMFLGACLDEDQVSFITEFMEGGDLE
eukprot:186879-Amphidinium_carterae.1